MSLTASDLVPANDNVAISGDQLWEPTALFLPDWGQPPLVENRYRTTVLHSRSVAENRFGLATKPQRLQKIKLRSLQHDDRQRFAAQLTRMSRSRFPMPLYTDRAKLTGKPQIDAFQYNGDFSDRRFQVGGWAVAVDDDHTATANDFQFRKILGVTDSQITLDGDLKESYDMPPAIVSHDQLYDNPPFANTQYTDYTYVQPGDIIFASMGALQTFGGVEGEYTSVVLQDNQGNETDITDSLIADLDQLAPDPPPFVRIRLGVVAYQLPPTASAARVRVKFTNSQQIGEGLAWTLTVVRGVHTFEGIAWSGFEDTNHPDPDNISLDHTTARANQKLLMLSSSWAPAAGGVTGASPGSFLATPMESNFPTGDWWTGVSEYTTPDATTPVTMSHARAMEEATQKIIFAVGIVLNPTETGGMHRKEIYPVIECDIEGTNTARTITRDSVSEATLEVQETQGESALDPLVQPGTAPEGYDTYLGHPILTDEINWSGVVVGTFRVLSRHSSGIANQITAFGEQPGATFGLPFRGFERGEVFNIIKFVDSRGGRLHPFWVANPSAALKVNSIAVDNATLRFDPRVKERDWEFYKYYAVLDKQTKTTSIHAVTAGPVEGAGEMVVTLDPPLPDDDASRYELTTAHLCRLESDALLEAWATDRASDIVLQAVELINEKTVNISLLDIVGDGGGDPWTPNSDFDICADLRCCDGPGECNFCGASSIAVTAYCYLSSSHPDYNAGCCPQSTTPCLLSGACSTLFLWDSCQEGTLARWEHSGGAFISITCDGDWSLFLDNWLDPGDCCEEIQAGDPCICEFPGINSCDTPSVIIDETCSSYTRKERCGNYEPWCNLYVTVLSAEVVL